MWEPLLQRDIDRGVVRDSWHGPAGRTVYCLLDPPRNALTGDAYRAAQRNLLGIYRQVQGARPGPLPVGLQEEFWRALRAAGRLPRGVADADAVRRAGHGVVAGIAAAPDPPPVYRLEDGAEPRRLEPLHAAATTFMTEGRPVFLGLQQAFDAAVGAACSPRFAEVHRLAAARRRDGSVPGGYLPALVGFVRAHRIPVRPEAELLARAVEHEAAADPAAVAWEHRQLRADVRAAAGDGAVDPLAAAELRLHELVDRHAADPAWAPELDAWRDVLVRNDRDAVPDPVVARVSAGFRDATGPYATDACPVKPWELNRARTAAAPAARLLALAVVLGLDVERYPTLARRVYAANLAHLLTTAGRGPLGALRVLEADAARGAAATPADRAAAALEPVMEVLAGFGRCHLGYDEPAQAVLPTLALEAVWDRLRDLHPGVPERLRAEARTLDPGLGPLRAFTAGTLRRAKLLVRRLLARMDEAAAPAAVLVVDGYLADAVGNALRPAASGCLLLPTW